MEPASQGKVVKRGKLKLWTGKVPPTPLAEAVEGARHYERAMGEARQRGVMGVAACPAGCSMPRPRSSQPR